MSRFIRIAFLIREEFGNGRAGSDPAIASRVESTYWTATCRSSTTERTPGVERAVVSALRRSV